MASSRFGILARQFSTSPVARGKLAQAPIQVFGTEGRYAHALFSAASKEKKIDVVDGNVKDLQKLLTTDAPLKEFMLNPCMNRLEKRSILESSLTKRKYSPLVVNTIGLMAENGRLKKLDGVLKAYGTIMSAVRGEVVCTVTTAKDLDSGSVKELEGVLKSFMKKGETIQLNTKVDPSIIGGMKVEIGDRYVDMSMATKIRTYTNLIKEGL